MSVYTSNNPNFSPAEHTFFRNFVKCDFCDCSHDEEYIDKVDGYDLCVSCKEEYLEDQKNNAELTN